MSTCPRCCLVVNGTRARLIGSAANCRHSMRRRSRPYGQRRRRVTVGQECGHLELHRGRALILDTSVRIDFRDRVSSQATDREEMEANRFAAALLMPEQMVVEAATAAPRDPEELVRSLARRFKVIEAAMGYRLINLGLLT